MVNAIQAAQGAAQKAIEATYFGTLTVTEMKKGKDERSKLTRAESVIVLENQPCKLSFETIKAAAQTDSVAAVSQITKLFVSPNVTIRAGSKLTITQDGVTADYARSGIPAVYPTHQEVILETFEKWA